MSLEDMLGREVGRQATRNFEPTAGLTSDIANALIKRIGGAFRKSEPDSRAKPKPSREEKAAAEEDVDPNDVKLTPPAEDAPIDPEAPRPLVPEDQKGSPYTLDADELLTNLRDPAEIVNPTGRVGRDQPNETFRNINMSVIARPETRTLLDTINRIQAGGEESPAVRQQKNKATLQLAETPEVQASVMKKIKLLAAGDLNTSADPAELVYIYRSTETHANELADFATELNELIKSGQDIPQEQLAAFGYLMEVTNEASSALRSGVAQAGRTLQVIQALKGDAVPGTLDYYKQINRVIESNDGPDNIINAIKLIAKTKEDANPADKEWWWRVLDSIKSRAPDLIVRMRYNMMLSSIRTHVANISGSTLAGAYEIPVALVARGFNGMEYVAREAAAKAFGTKRMNPLQRMTVQDLIYGQQKSITEGAIEGMKAAYAIAKGGGAPDEMVGKVWNEMGIRYDFNEPPGVASKILETPARMLEAEDAFFRNVFYSQKLNELLYRQAKANANGDTKLLKGELERLTKNPPENLKEDATLYSQKMTFTNDPSIYGSFLRTVGDGLATVQQSHWLMQTLVPFVKTPVNLFGYAMDASGIGVALHPSKTAKEIFGSNAQARSEALARISIAAGLFTVMVQYLDDETITGMGPADYGKKRLWEANGWRENAIKIDGVYYQLNRMDPLGLALGIMATARDAMNVAERSGQDTTVIAGEALLAVADALYNRSMLVGVGEALELLQGGSPKQLAALTVSSAASYYTPNFIRDIREAKDPYRRDMSYDASYDGIMSRFKKSWLNAGWNSDQLPIAVDPFGRPIMNGGGAMWRASIPIRLGDSNTDMDPVASALILAQTSIKPPGPTVPIAKGLNKNTLEMDNYEGAIYNEYKRIVGDTTYKILSQVVSSSSFKKQVQKYGLTPDSIPGIIIDKAVADARLAGRKLFLGWLIDRQNFRPSVMSKDGKKIYLTKEVDGKEVQVVKTIPEEHRMTKASLREAIRMVFDYTSPDRQERINTFLAGGSYQVNLESIIPGKPADIVDVLSGTRRRELRLENPREDPKVAPNESMLDM